MRKPFYGFRSEIERFIVSNSMSLFLHDDFLRTIYLSLVLTTKLCPYSDENDLLKKAAAAAAIKKPNEGVSTSISTVPLFHTVTFQFHLLSSL